MDLFFFEKRHRKLFAGLVVLAFLLWAAILAVYMFEDEIAEAYMRHKSEAMLADKDQVEIATLPGGILSTITDLGIQCSGTMCYATPLPQDGGKGLSNYYLSCDDVWIIAIPAECIVDADFEHSHDEGVACRMPMKLDQCCVVWTPEWFFYVQRHVPNGEDSIAHDANGPVAEGLRVECYGSVETPDVLWACW